MATIRTAIKINDGMSPAFRSMNKAMNIVLNSFAAVQKASSNSIDTSSIQAARRELSSAEVILNQVEQDINGAGGAQDKFNDKLQRGRNHASGLSRQISRMVMRLGAAAGIGKTLGLSDELASTKARLNLVNDGLQTTAELQNMIFKSSERSRGSYLDTAKSVSKLGILARDAFGSNQETIAFAEQMNKQFKIGGASIEEQTAGMYQLTQAMAAGRLQGDEFRSIMENAPMLAQSIAEYLGVSTGELREMSSEGLITADVIKNALFASAEETNERFAQLPLTFGDVWTSIRNNAIQAFEPLLSRMNEIANSDRFQALINGIISGATTLARVLLGVFDIVLSIAGFFQDNWSVIEPIVWGLVAAFTAWKVVTLAVAAAKWVQAAAQWALNSAILACPLTWIIVAVAAVIAAIVAWVKSVGGLKVAWLIVVNAILTAWDWVKIAFFTGVYWVVNLFNKMKLGFMTVGVAIANYMGDMKANVLMILQNLVNGAINIINGFIGVLNKIPGVNIGLIEQVTFGTDAKLKNEAEKQARNAALEDYRSEIEAGIAERDAALENMRSDAASAAAERAAEIAAAKADGASPAEDAANKAGGAEDALGGIYDNTGATAENTGSIADTMEATEEDLKYLRDLAEQETINRFTTAEIKVEMTNHNSISDGTDLDGVVTYLEEKIYETMEAAAEGVHDV